MISKGTLISIGFKNIGFKLVLEGEPKEIWMNCADSAAHKSTAYDVYGFSKRLFNNNNKNVEVEYSVEQGKYYAFRLEAVNASATRPISTPLVQILPNPQQTQVQLIKTENKPSTIAYNYPTEYNRPQVPEVRAEIRNQATNHDVSMIVNGALIALTGQVTIENIGTTIIHLINVIEKKLK